MSDLMIAIAPDVRVGRKTRLDRGAQLACGQFSLWTARSSCCLAGCTPSRYTHMREMATGLVLRTCTVPQMLSREVYQARPGGLVMVSWRETPIDFDDGC